MNEIGQQGSGSGNRVLRGGSWINNARNCRSAYRNGNRPGNRDDNVGFRPASSSHRQSSALAPRDRRAVYGDEPPCCPRRDC